MKQLQAIKNNTSGYDFIAERHAGSTIRYFTGQLPTSLEYWKRLRELADDVVWELENVNDTKQKQIING